MRHFSADGTASGPEFIVHAYTTGDQSGGAVELGDDGGFVVAWTSDTQDGDAAGGFARWYAAGDSCRSAQRSRLLLITRGGTKDRLKWKWSRGAATTAAAFGDRAATTFTATIIDATGPVAGLALAPLQPWVTLSSGWRYKDRDGASDGLTKAVLKHAGGRAGKAAITLKGSGAGLGLQDLADLALTPPVTVVFRRGTDECWAASYFSPTRNDARRFKAKQ